MSSAPSNRDVLNLVRAWVEANYPGCPLEHVDIHCRFLASPVILADCPYRPLVHNVATSEDTDAGHEADTRSYIRRGRDNEDLDPIADIFSVLKEAEKPLTLKLMQQEMKKRDLPVWSDRTLARHLAILIADGSVENPAGARPCGYRMTEGHGKSS